MLVNLCKKHINESVTVSVHRVLHEEITPSSRGITVTVPTCGSVGFALQHLHDALAVEAAGAKQHRPGAGMAPRHHRKPGARQHER